MFRRGAALRDYASRAGVFLNSAFQVKAIEADPAVLSSRRTLRWQWAARLQAWRVTTAPPLSACAGAQCQRLRFSTRHGGSAHDAGASTGKGSRCSSASSPTSHVVPPAPAPTPSASSSCRASSASSSPPLCSPASASPSTTPTTHHSPPLHYRNPHTSPPNKQATMSSTDCLGEPKLLEVLKSIGIELPTIEHEEKHTVEEANKELGRFGVSCTGTKNMFLKSKKGEFVLLCALHTTPTDMKRIQKEAGVKDLRFAPEDLLRENLHVVQGSVTPFALVNNLDKRNMCVILDKNLVDATEPFVLHPCRNDKSCLVTFPQLKAFMDKIEYPFKVVDFGAAGAAPAPAATAAAPKPKKAEGKKAEGAVSAPSTVATSGETKLGILAKKDDNFASWYTEVITKAEMIEYYDVSGCYIIRPWGYYIWKCVQRFLGDRIEALGVEDCYFPMFVSKSCLEREKEHVEGFAPEVAWVTRAGSDELEVPVAIRPTSETVIYPYYAKWIRSYRDLPVRLNMWNNVIRWEFSHPTPFIRTREFLWQEGHCAYATEDECMREVMLVLDSYAAVYEHLLAVPVVKGRKTEKEKFAGGYITTTVETYIDAVGRGCQGATSHNLGQNFGKMFDIRFQDPEKNDGSTIIPWQNSWGLTTRVIGVMIMVHSDNQGIVLPPRVASVQCVIVPVGITKDTTDEQKSVLVRECKELEQELVKGGVRAKADLRDNYSPGWRFNHWEVKGVPIRIELGPKELASKELALAIRHNGEKKKMAWNAQTPANLAAMLEEIQETMYNRACATREAHTIPVTEWEKFVPALNNKCVLLAPWCGDMACEDQVKKDSAEESKAAQAADTREDARAPSMGAKTLCIPFKQPGPVDGLTCICKDCKKPATTWVLFGRSY